MSEDNKDLKHSLSVVQMSNYVQPEIVEASYSNKYVTFGEGNSYFTYLNECYRGSPTNSSIINSIGQMIYGKGIDFVGSDKKTKQLKALRKLLKARDLRLIAMDFKQYGQCALQVGYNIEHTKIVVVKHQPIMTIAKGKMDRTGNINKYWYSADFSDVANYPPKSIPAFGKSKAQVELLYINNYTYSSGLLYYSTTDYQAGLQYCKAEEEISNYHVNNIRNAFSPSMLLTFRDGKPDVKEQLRIETKVKEKWGGSSNAGSIMVAFTEEGEDPPTVDSIQLNKAAEQYKFVSKEATEKLLVVHRITSRSLLGLDTSNGFSDKSSEMITSYKLLNTTVIQPFQDILLEGISELLEFNGFEEDLFFIPLFPIDFLEEDVDVAKTLIQKETGITGDKPEIKSTVTSDRDGQLKTAS